jgi:hypothetical protein
LVRGSSIPRTAEPIAVTPEEIVRKAIQVFRTDAEQPPPLTLRGGNAVDGYDQAEPFDPAKDEPSDEYIEGFAFWGLGYLDAQSWRHYLPKLIDYAYRKPEDPAMAVGALIRTLRPPDRYPPRLSTLSPVQEEVVAAFLEAVALGGAHGELAEDGQQALEEWWLPGARHRPSAAEVAALRATPMQYQTVERALYRLRLPASLSSSGASEIPEESRNVEVWGGYLCGDAHTTVAVNITPAEIRSVPETLERAAGGLRAARVDPRGIRVPGAARAGRLDGSTRGDSPAEPQRITLVAAAVGAVTVLLTIRSWPREDVDAAVERIAESFELVED